MGTLMFMTLRLNTSLSLARSQSENISSNL